jgi:hypothetical protein
VGHSSNESVKGWLASHTSSEVLNLIGWDTNTEKILLMGAFHESNGGEEGWRSGDVEQRFSVAGETFPANFYRDLGGAVGESWVGKVTPRTYKVGRAGWNKIAEAIKEKGL